jgi:hypothetical protein
VILVAILLLTSHRLQFSPASCVFIALFILVHILGAHQLGWRVATKRLETTNKNENERPQKLLDLRFREEVFLLLINGFLTPTIALITSIHAGDKNSSASFFTFRRLAAAFSGLVRDSPKRFRFLNVEY